MLLLPVVQFAPVFASLLLHKLAVTALAGIGPRKLRGAYSGPCVRVRRSSDNAETEIGFDRSNNMDASGIGSFCGSASGYVSKWYDHGPGANHRRQPGLDLERIGNRYRERRSDAAMGLLRRLSLAHAVPRRHNALGCRCR